MTRDTTRVTCDITRVACDITRIACDITAPLQLNADPDALTRQKEAAASELLQLQATIQACKQSYALLISSVQTIKSEISSVTDKLQRSSELILNLAAERARWKAQRESFAAEQQG